MKLIFAGLVKEFPELSQEIFQNALVLQPLLMKSLNAFSIYVNDNQLSIKSANFCESCF